MLKARVKLILFSTAAYKFSLITMWCQKLGTTGQDKIHLWSSSHLLKILFKIIYYIWFTKDEGLNNVHNV